ncbi:MAG TPA: methyltransferase [Geminicoccus sp.]|uniref:tRNA1(Val) (adenine(37)-N6)-methyltransferase n=1 Tax=Geminicoccus sp. TaxID=2024832 RepID=UPI002E33B2E3|nr:methyltransferase [Geminicoccus sp.]HEX2526844.1 methyltransferase [Geminicoccus sp.]
MKAVQGRDRPALDAVLLGAAAPVQAKERILDAGCGSGAVGLCVAARTNSPNITAIDVAPDAVAEASANILANGWQDRFEVRQADLAGYKDRQGFDLVLSNPPYHDQDSSRSPDEQRERARFGQLALSAWIGHCLRLCRPRGHLVVILRADRIVETVAAMDGIAGDVRILPVHPYAGGPAHRVLIHARKAVRTPARLLGGFVLHADDRRWTEGARAVLERGAAIDWDRGDAVC